jgi:uncharacterized protein (TIGR02284 family)
MNTDIGIEREALRSLKELVDLNTHSQEIYRYASEHIDNPGIQSELQLIADERASQAWGLERILKNFSAVNSPVGRADFLAPQSLHPCWTGVKEALGGNDTFLALEELEKGELCIEGVYRNALDLTLPPSVHLMVESHVLAVANTHRRTQNLRDAARPRQ